MQTPSAGGAEGEDLLDIPRALQTSSEARLAHAAQDPLHELATDPVVKVSGVGLTARLVETAERRARLPGLARLADRLGGIQRRTERRFRVVPAPARRRHLPLEAPRPALVLPGLGGHGDLE